MLQASSYTPGDGPPPFPQLNQYAPALSVQEPRCHWGTLGLGRAAPVLPLVLAVQSVTEKCPSWQLCHGTGPELLASPAGRNWFSEQGQDFLLQRR